MNIYHSAVWGSWTSVFRLSKIVNILQLSIQGSGGSTRFDARHFKVNFRIRQTAAVSKKKFTKELAHTSQKPCHVQSVLVFIGEQEKGN